MYSPYQQRVGLDNGFVFALKRWGKMDNPAIIACHGWLDNAGSFDRLAPLLADAYCVYAVDLPGHGWSDYGEPYQSWSIINSLALLYQLPEALGLSSYQLVGHSLGACLSCLLAAIDKRASRAVFIDGYLPVAREGTRFIDDLKQNISKRIKKKRSGFTYSQCVEKLARIRKIPYEYGALLAERALRKTSEGWQVANAESFRQLPNQYLAPTQVQAFLKELTCPCHLLLAKDGIPAYTDYMLSSTAQIQSLSVIELEGGHYLHLESPEHVASLIHDFLE